MTTATLLAPAPAATTPPPVQWPRPYRWTVQQFHDANEQGVFGEGSRVILIHGELVEQGPMNPTHAMGVGLVNAVLSKVFAEGFYVRVQLPIFVKRDTDPIPDFAVVVGSPRDFPTHPTTAALVVEVADSSLALDTTTKAELYATAGIADYWVIDIQHRVLLVFRDPSPLPDGGMHYRTQLALTPADSVSPLAAPTATIRVADLLP
ncbi:Uma2 family endonuclease [Limnoglobus roseus]|uniref:Uma2 family endonuclease n=1 Tax=Limnoglobus roseus TaxID=2598579 RepID=A0A5C1AF35_9BACT|nr:Uma2 family endonuclease [Limnoglobus roseus]QEL15744.1 Uma2 family endonuclease [Limnoglobus roseus]